jgi:transposase
MSVTGTTPAVETVATAHSLPPTGSPTGGVDWAKDDHAVAVVAPDGQQTHRFSVPHDATGLRVLVKRLVRAGVVEVGIERPDGPVVDALRTAGLTVFVIPPAQLKNLRSRYGSAGDKDDRFDAYVLADVVRTDRRRLRPLLIDTPDTTALRQLTRARKDLVAHRVAVANQLRAHLQICFPGAVGLFHDIDSDISLRFLERFTSQERADWLSVRRWTAWLSAAGYCGRTSADTLHQRLTGAPRGTTGPAGDTAAAVTAAFVATLRTITTQIDTLAARITEQLTLHPDAPVLTSLPRSGTVRAARLLAEIGDARGRFPTPDSLACLAGVAPSTRQSGKVRAVSFRWGADKQLRDALRDFAGDSRHANPWAAHHYQRARDRGHDHPHAVRILARAWTAVIWACWTTHTPYNPQRHPALQRVLNQDQPTAAPHRATHALTSVVGADRPRSARRSTPATAPTKTSPSSAATATEANSFSGALEKLEANPRIWRPRPSDCPAGSSPTIAPMTEAVAAIFRAGKRAGRAAGNSSRRKLCPPEAAYERRSSRVSGSGERSPWTVAIVTG